jgi:hypothetical protein
MRRPDGVELVIRALLAVVLVCGVAQTSAAQPQTQVQDPDPLESARVRLGSFGFTPTFFVTSGYDSNVTREVPAMADWETVASPQVAGWLTLGSFRFSGVGALEFVTYPRVEPNFTFNRDFNVEAKFAGAHLVPQIRYSYFNHYARPTGFEVNGRSERIQDDVTASLRWNIGGRTSVSAQAYHLNIDWSAEAKYEGSELRESLNRSTNIGTIGVAVALSPLTDLTVDVRAGTDRFPYSPSRNANSVQVSGRFDFRSPALLSGFAHVGYRHFESPDSGLRTFNGIVSSVALAYVRESRTRVLLAYDRAPNFSYLQTLGYYVLSSGSAAYVQALSESWEASIFGGYHSLDYTPAGSSNAASQATWRSDGGAGVSRRVGLAAKVGINASYFSVRGGQQFSGWRAVAYLTYGSQTLQRLERPLPDER